MYPLPDDFDPETLCGRELERVSFVPFAIELVLEGDVMIRVFSEIVHEGVDGDTRWHEGSSAPIRRSSVMRLVGSNVTRAAVEERATLVLGFDNGDTLHVVEDTDMYECYHLHIGDREIIV